VTRSTRLHQRMELFELHPQNRQVPPQVLPPCAANHQEGRKNSGRAFFLTDHMESVGVWHAWTSYLPMRRTLYRLSRLSSPKGTTRYCHCRHRFKHPGRGAVNSLALKNDGGNQVSRLIQLFCAMCASVQPCNHSSRQHPSCLRQCFLYPLNRLTPQIATSRGCGLEHCCALAAWLFLTISLILVPLYNSCSSHFPLD
jgi:hypothetical protein